MKKPTILILDGHGDLQTALRQSLSALGYQVVENGQASGAMPHGAAPAVDRMAHSQPDVPVVVLSSHEGDGSRTIIVRPQQSPSATEPPCAARLSHVATSAAEPPRVPDSVA
jgi:CheY-like chemotaxis protein